MLSLNDIIKKRQVQSRRGVPTMIVQTPIKRGCPGCGRKKLVDAKINNALQKLKEKQ